jgi:pyruvate dehydrogenase E2 component (dihydrolipoamide acetyltransferase)
VANEFRLPDIGEGLTEAEIVRWLIPEGERVEADQPVVEVETDKAVVEIPSPFAGTVLRHGGAEGETIAVGDVLVVIGEPDEKEEPAEQAPPTVAPIVGTLSEDAEELTTATGNGGGAAAVKALPVVRKLARDMGVDLSSITGSGPEGRITREDVLAAGEVAPAAEPPEPEEVVVEPALAPEPVSPAATVSPPIERSELWGESPEGGREASPEPEPEGLSPQERSDVGGSAGEAGRGAATATELEAEAGDERRPMSRLRRTIAANMAKSWAEIPHVTTFDDVDATRLLEIRSALGARHDLKIPMEALVVKAVVPALEAFPEFNATIDGDDLVLHHSYDIGIAVDTPDGLLVAVIEDAGSRGVLELAAEVTRLGDGAKARSLSPAELTGQTFTVTNIGAVGGGHGTPIVPFGTTAILSVGRAQEKVVAVDGELAIAPLMPLSLSYDHRVVDGAQGRRFMALVIENLEEPALFLAG